MIKLIIVRHGQSTYNKKNLFTGWLDVGLTIKGVQEAKKAGKIIKNNNMTFDIDEIADLAMYLLSDNAKMICGETVIVDGGYSIR